MKKFSFPRFLFTPAALLLIVFGVGFYPHPAEAALSFCNRTSGAIEAAVGYRGEDKEKDDNWISEGWWRIEPGQCARVVAQPLSQRFYYYYGRALTKVIKDAPPTEWSGKYSLCTDNKAFRAEGDNCAAQKLQSTGFQIVDVGAGVKDYVLDFKDALTK